MISFLYSLAARAIPPARGRRGCDGLLRHQHRRSRDIDSVVAWSAMSAAFEHITSMGGGMR